MRMRFPSSYPSSFSWEKLKYKRGVTEEPAAKIWNFHSQGEERGKSLTSLPRSGPAQVRVYCPEEMGRTARAPTLGTPGSVPLSERQLPSPSGLEKEKEKPGARMSWGEM